MNSATNINLVLKGLNIFDEFEGNEIEAKIDFYPKKPDLFICLLKRNIKKNKDFLFKLIPGKEETLNWTYYFDRYGYREDYKFIEAYNLIYHPNKNKFWIKVKKQPKDIKNKDGILIRKEDLIRFERKMNKVDVDVILQKKTKELRKNLSLLGTIKRDKFYLLVQNIKSSRYYSVSADRCQYKKFRLSQVEIEYKGIDKTKKTRLSSSKLRELIKQEIFLFSEFLIEKTDKQFRFKRTSQTKFEWLSFCLNQEKK